MRYQKQIDKIRAGGYLRSELVQLRENVQLKVSQGDPEARQLLAEIDRAAPTDSYVVFMGFCPSADINNRLDIEWKRLGVCTFVFHESDQQSERFNAILPGDLIILKKRHRFGETMQLFGYGRVVGVKYDSENHRYLEVNWANQEEIIEVPLMGCNATVDTRSIEQIEGQMPEEFFTWLGKSN
jgi:hypothetical protein